MWCHMSESAYNHHVNRIHQHRLRWNDDQGCVTIKSEVCDGNCLRCWWQHYHTFTNVLIQLTLPVCRDMYKRTVASHSNTTFIKNKNSLFLFKGIQKKSMWTVFFYCEQFCRIFFKNASDAVITITFLCASYKSIVKM